MHRLKMIANAIIDTCWSSVMAIMAVAWICGLVMYALVHTETPRTQATGTDADGTLPDASE